MTVRRRMRRLEKAADEILRRRGNGADAFGRKATVFLVAVEWRIHRTGAFADLAQMEARYREQLAAYGLEFVEEFDQPNLEHLSVEMARPAPGRRILVESTT